MPDAPSLACLVPCCGRLVHRRGLCDAHYRLVLERIRRGLTTWAAEEALGQAAPPGRGSSGARGSCHERRTRALR
jgi:hypothetical protein